MGSHGTKLRKPRHPVAQSYLQKNLIARRLGRGGRSPRPLQGMLCLAPGQWIILLVLLMMIVTWWFNDPDCFPYEPHKSERENCCVHWGSVTSYDITTFKDEMRLLGCSLKPTIECDVCNRSFCKASKRNPASGKSGIVCHKIHPIQWVCTKCFANDRIPTSPDPVPTTTTIAKQSPDESLTEPSASPTPHLRSALKK